jgi:hypothetical protein
MSVILQSSGGGQITLQEPTTASNFTQTLPAASGEVMVSGNQPAFSAYTTASQNIASATFTKAALTLEYFDTNNNFDSTTNYRFTPTIAGYYQINASSTFTTALGINGSSIYKNGGAYAGNVGVSSSAGYTASVSALIYMNGSTDYLELYVYQSSGSTAPTYVAASQFAPQMSGVLVRAS